MPVTEFALIRLRDSYDELDFLEILMQCQEVQDEWLRLNQPCALPSTTGPSLSSMYIQKTEPPYLLITAPWDSPLGHREWIKSKENQAIFAKLSEFIAPGCSSTLLFHMDSAGTETQLRGEFRQKEETFDIYRLFTNPGKKDAIEQKYRGLEKDVAKLSPGAAVWAGWRIEKSSDEEEELVVFRSRDVPDAQMKELLDLAVKSEHHSFHHVV